MRVRWAAGIVRAQRSFGARLWRTDRLGVRSVPSAARPAASDGRSIAYARRFALFTPVRIAAALSARLAVQRSSETIGTIAAALAKAQTDRGHPPQLSQEHRS
jgi:hypothetical protein